MTLREYIEDEIRSGGPMPFSRYMELCLYGVPGASDPALRGYYTREREQFGKSGDFYTSSDVHAVFGRLLARQFEQMWRSLGSPTRLDLIELGPGRGLFAQDVLDWSDKKFPEFAQALHYTLVETSPTLRIRLQERFAERIAAGKIQVCDDVQEVAGFRSPDRQITRSPDQFTEAPRTGAPHLPVFARCGSDFIVFANEFFDALPVEVVAQEGSLRVTLDGSRFAETFAPASPAELAFLDRYSVHPEPGERVEATLAALDYLRRIAAALPEGARGYLVLIDYGYLREEQLAGRHRGTVMAMRRHAVSNTPYEAPGEQDITAHVNFTALSEVARECGLEKLGLVTQSQFLMGIGEPNQFADAFEDCRLPQEHAKVALQLKHLATPVGLGDTFQVLVLGKGIAKEKAAGLSGLTFDRS